MLGPPETDLKTCLFKSTHNAVHILTRQIDKKGWVESWEANLEGQKVMAKQKPSQMYAAIQLQIHQLHSVSSACKKTIPGPAARQATKNKHFLNLVKRPLQDLIGPLHDLYGPCPGPQPDWCRR